MSRKLDLAIRGADVVDGLGNPPVRADIGVIDGVIAAVGDCPGTAVREFDATGLLVTPGTVDLHTHYDGQLFWDPAVSPSCYHGVTTVVTGNCGVGFAPVREANRDWVIALMEGVEDIPAEVLQSGMPWNWETFPEYMDSVDFPHALDFAVQVPHAALRVYAMGERGVDHRERASASEIDVMRRCLGEAIEMGAIGWTTSRASAHKTKSGLPTPTLSAPADELLALARELAARGRGVIELITDFENEQSEFELISTLAQTSGRPVSVTILQRDHSPDAWRRQLDWIQSERDRTGLVIHAQVAPRAVGFLFGWDLSWHPFVDHPSFRALQILSAEDRAVALRTPDVRKSILADTPDTDDPGRLRLLGSFDRMFVLGDPPDYEPPPDRSVAALARARGLSPTELAYDLMLGVEGSDLLYFPNANYSEGNLDAVHDMLVHPASVPGLSDGGAHAATICDASFPTSMMTFWGRDRVLGSQVDLPHLVKMQTSDTANAMGLTDRGSVTVGLRADLNVIDFENLDVGHPLVQYDLPGGHPRLVQRAIGYKATFVAGEAVVLDDELTGARPGRLVRGG